MKPENVRTNVPPKKMRITVGSTIRMKDYDTAGGYRLWHVVAHNLGGTNQEGSFKLVPMDKIEGTEDLNVPCVMIETDPRIEVLNRQGRFE